MSFNDQQTWAGTAGGTANAISLTLPDITTLADLVGVPVRFIVATTNTAATTAAVSGTPATSIRKLTAGGLAALVGNEFIAGNSATIVYNGSTFVISSPTPTIVPTSSSVIGFTSSGTYTPSVGVSRVFVQLWAAGGGGFTVGFGSLASGDGGGAGEYRQGVFSIVPGASISIAIGVGGAPDTSGTLSSFGSYMTANPGGGATGNNGNGPGAGGTGGTGGFGFPGGSGNPGFTTGGHDILLGNGGAAFGTSISNPISAVGGHQANGNFPGGGATGGNGGGGIGTPIAGTGGNGLCLIQELGN